MLKKSRDHKKKYMYEDTYIHMSICGIHPDEEVIKLRRSSLIHSNALKHALKNDLAKRVHKQISQSIIHYQKWLYSAERDSESIRSNILRK